MTTAKVGYGWARFWWTRYPRGGVAQWVALRQWRLRGLRMLHGIGKWQRRGRWL